jgi:hypothetical protein
MRRPLIAILILVLILGAGAIVWYVARSSAAHAPTPTASIPIQSTIESATLTAAAGQTGTGIATRQFIDGMFIHGVTAELPDPPAGQSYAGWLVQGGDTASAEFTGTLMKQGADYTLDYSSPTDQQDFSEVRITLQTTLNQPMQSTVLSGTFSTQ